jgi:hypothetical protein
MDCDMGFAAIFYITVQRFIIPAGLSARGGFIRLWRIYPPDAELFEKI